MDNKIVLIDGHSILNRAFYGVPELTNAEGLHTNAIYGFLSILFKILEEENPNYLTVMFDVNAPTFRHEMFKEYKGTRKPMLEELRQQVPVMKEVLKAMNIQIVELAGYEADDLIGTFANHYEKEGFDVSVISGDRDLLQLATEKTKIRIPKTKQGRTEVEDYYAVDVEERYKVTPKEFIDLKALMGDASDNIPGVPSIGEVTATKIITAYGSIENAYAHVEELKPPRASKAMAEHYDKAQLSKVLATIDVNVPISFDIEKAKRQEFYTKEAYTFFQKLQFKNFLSRFNIEADSHKVEEYFKVITTRKEADKVFEEAGIASIIGISFATNTGNILPLFAHESGFSGVGLCYGDKKVFELQTSSELSMEYLLEKLTILGNKVETIVAMDVKRILPYIKLSNNELWFDVLVAAYLMNPLNNHYIFEDIAREYLNFDIDVKVEGSAKACYEAYTVYKSMPLLREELKKSEMDQLYKKIEMPLVFALFHMEQVGIKTKAEELRQLSEKLSGQIEVLEKEIHEAAGEKFNINSPKQLGIVLFENLGLPHGKKTKTGYSTAVDVLEKLAEEFPVVSKILEYRQLAKLKSTYADGLGNYIQADGRIHGTFNQTIAATGRISSTEPNLQNIPIRMELGRLIRKVFVPEDGYVFVDADYSQIELRILAHCSGDEQLINAYKEAKDIHRITASQVFHTPFEEVSDLQRRNAKAVNFGIVYGISSFGLSQDLSITRKEASEYIASYFETYPGIKGYLDGTVAFAKEHGYAVTLFGRRRPVPELASSNFMQRSFGERVAMNSPLQGTAADIMKVAMIGVDNALKKENMKSKVVLQVHDELLIEAHQEEVEQVKQILEQEMTNAASLKVPLEIDIHTGESWYDAK